MTFSPSSLSSTRRQLFRLLAITAGVWGLHDSLTAPSAWAHPALVSIH